MVLLKEKTTATSSSSSSRLATGTGREQQRPERNNTGTSYEHMLREYERSIFADKNPGEVGYVPKGMMDSISLSMFSNAYQLALANNIIIDTAENTTNERKTDDPKIKKLNTLSDPRMGPIDTHSTCDTCNLHMTSCTGHYGYMPFNTAIYHPMSMKPICIILSAVCPACKLFILNRDKEVINKFTGFSGYRRLMEIRSFVNNKFCPNASCNSNIYSYDVIHGQVMRVNKDGDNSIFHAEEAYSILNGISNDDAKLLGFKADDSISSSHPRNLIMHGMLVIPPIVRPPIIIDDIQDDNPFTTHYKNILLAVTTLKKAKVDNNKNDQMSAYGHLVQRVAGVIKSNNSFVRKGGRESSLQKMFQGKYGLPRGVFQGKGVDFSARTVISPDPFIKLNQISLPNDWKSAITKPERVTTWNRKSLQVDLFAGKIKSIIKVGTGISRVVTAKILEEHASADINNLRTLQVGDVVHRHLRDGDLVIVNRQPTLHAASMIALEAVFKPQYTIGFSGPITTPLNADFDGDEATVHFPQTLGAIAEMQQLMTPKNILLNNESEKMMMSHVYDAGMMLMTQPTDPTDPTSSVYIDPAIVSDCIMQLSNQNDMLTYTERLREQGGIPLTGKALFSTLLPAGFYYTTGDVVIRDGILVSGTITGSHTGTGGSSILYEMIHDPMYGSSRTEQFINDINFVTNRWMQTYGMTFSIKDLMLNMPGLEEARAELISIHKKQAMNLGRLDQVRDEETMVGIVENLKAKMYNYIVKRIPTDNTMSVYTRAELGKMTSNVPQIIGLIGQAFVSAKRLPPTLTGGTRCLPTYDPGDFGIEARGCILNSFASKTGLNMSEYFYLMQAGRPALTNMAITTQFTGDLQNNKLVKGLEGVILARDGTVRNSAGKIIQYTYGGDGTSPGHLFQVSLAKKEKGTDNEVGRVTFFANIKAIIHNLNAKYGYDKSNKFNKNTMSHARKQMLYSIGACNYEETDQETVDVETNQTGARIVDFKDVKLPEVIVDAIDTSVLSEDYLKLYTDNNKIVDDFLTTFYTENSERARRQVAGKQRILRRQVSAYDVHMQLMEFWHYAVFVLINFQRLFSEVWTEPMSLYDKNRLQQEWVLYNYTMMGSIDSMKVVLGKDFERYKFDSFTRDVLIQDWMKKNMPESDKMFYEYHKKIWLSNDPVKIKAIMDSINAAVVQTQLDELWNKL